MQRSITRSAVATILAAGAAAALSEPALAVQPTGFQPLATEAQPTGFDPVVVEVQPSGFLSAQVSIQPLGFLTAAIDRPLGYDPQPIVKPGH